jgi:hypothetical protein
MRALIGTSFFDTCTDQRFAVVPHFGVSLRGDVGMMLIGAVCLCGCFDNEGPEASCLDFTQSESCWTNTGDTLVLVCARKRKKFHSINKDLLKTK